MQELTVNDLNIMSKAFAASGFFGCKTADQALALMFVAQANGIHPAKAVERYHIINGKPSMKSDAMLAVFQESGGSTKWVKRDKEEVILWLSHPKGGELEVKWDRQRATEAGLWGKDNWKKYPVQMLSARCVSEGVRALYPACLNGMYAEEEVVDFDDKKEVPLENVVDVNTPTNPPRKMKAQEVQEAVQLTEEEKTQNFLNMMASLESIDPQKYVDELGKIGYAEAVEIPSEKRRGIYLDLSRILQPQKEANNG